METEIAERNKALVHELYGILMAQGDVEAAQRILADEYRDHDLSGVGEGGRAELVEHWGMFDMLGILQRLGAVPA